MKKELVTLETAKLAKEKGFTEPTHYYFSKQPNQREYEVHWGVDSEHFGDYLEYDWNTNGEPFKPYSTDCYSRPTQFQLFKWLREKHKIFMNFNGNEHFTSFQVVRPEMEIMSYVRDKPNHFEIAFELALFKALKTVEIFTPTQQESLRLHKVYVEGLSDEELNNIMKEFDDYEVE